MVCHGEKSSRFPPWTRFSLSCDPLTCLFQVGWLFEFLKFIWLCGVSMVFSMVSVGLNFKGTQARNIVLKPAAGGKSFQATPVVGWCKWTLTILWPKNDTRILCDGCLLPVEVQVGVAKKYIRHSGGRIFSKKLVDLAGFWVPEATIIADPLLISPQFHHDFARGPITIHQSLSALW